MKILIIEDEKLLQQELKFQLNSIGITDIVNCISTVSESIIWLSKSQQNIDLIFMDIELADGISFEIFESINITKPVVFVTAYSKYAIKAFKVNSIDYILKPVQAKDLAFAINKFRNRELEKPSLDINDLKNVYSRTSAIKRILIQSGQNFKYLDYNEIAYFEADNKYISVVTFSNKKHLIDESLNSLALKLPEAEFFHTSRKYIVNIKAIVRASKYTSGRLKIYLPPKIDTEIIVSRNKAKDFLDWMGK